jgi:hypothetical protein
MAAPVTAGWSLSRDGRDRAYRRPENMGASAACKRETREAPIWGHEDHAIQDRPTITGMDEGMDRYLASFSVSHWRSRHGSIVHRSYSDVQQTSKRIGMMIMEPGTPKKFNVILHKDDPFANIDSIENMLKAHFMVCVGSTGLEYIQHKGHKDSDVKDFSTGDHASPWDLIVRCHKLRSFKVGLTKNGDLTGRKNETDLRHAWIMTLGMPNCGNEIHEEMANFLCHLIAMQPPYPERFGGTFSTGRPIAAIPRSATRQPFIANIVNSYPSSSSTGSHSVRSPIRLPPETRTTVEERVIALEMARSASASSNMPRLDNVAIPHQAAIGAST